MSIVQLAPNLCQMVPIDFRGRGLLRRTQHRHGMMCVNLYITFVNQTVRMGSFFPKTAKLSVCPPVGAQDANSTSLKVQAASDLKLGGVGVFTGEGLAKAGAKSYWRALEAFKQGMDFK
eukprot:COSAG02_NODE_2793_length_8017_cov_6.303738_4_plen_119_part_00